MIRVVVADDHHLVRQGIRALLDKAHDIQVVGEAQDGQEAIELTVRLMPDVLVTDISMPRLNGTEAILQVHRQCKATRIVVLSMYADPSLVRQALRNGATGYVLKRSVTDELLMAVRAASRSETYLNPAVSSSVLTDFLTYPTVLGKAEPADKLTARERQALQLIAEGHTNNKIAEIMQISVKTVEKHRASLMRKLDTHDVASLMRVAIKLNLIFLD